MQLIPNWYIRFLYQNKRTALILWMIGLITGVGLCPEKEDEHLPGLVT